jgi:hypothetical protein
MEPRVRQGAQIIQPSVGAIIEEQLFAKNVRAGVGLIHSLKLDEISFNLASDSGAMDVWDPQEGRHIEKMAKAGLTYGRTLFGFAEKDKGHRLAAIVFYCPYQPDGVHYDPMNARKRLLRAMRGLSEAGLSDELAVMVIMDPYGKPQGYQTANDVGGIFPEVEGAPNHSQAKLGEYLKLRT